MASQKALLGFIAGVSMGALAGILFAPDKGSKTRKKISDKSGNIADSVKNSFSDFIDSVKDAYGGTKNEAEDAAEKAKAKMNALKQDTKNALS